MTALGDRLRPMLASAPRRALLGGDDLDSDNGTEPVAAAVLMAITDRPRPGLILTTRREHLRTHAGQVAFPGGRLDEGEDVIAAALREAEEEIGLQPRHVDVLGAVDPYRTITAYRITPVLAIVPPDLPLAPHEPEVADWFEAPLDYLLDRSNQHRRSALFGGRDRHYYEILWQGRRIWGATAAMIVNLSARLEWR